MLRRAALRLRSGSDRAKTKYTLPEMERNYNPHAPPRSFTHDEKAAIRPDEPLSKWMGRYINDHAFEAKPSDHKAFGGDGATRKSEMREQAQHIDRRWSHPSHPQIQEHVLKGADRYAHPSGMIFDNTFLAGKIVGLAVMHTDRRSLHFYEQLDAFQRANPKAFVAIAMSPNGVPDQPALAKRFGLSFLGYRDGAKLVLRDLGLTFTNFPGMYPKLLIVDGSTGYILDRYGYQAVYVRPEDAMRAWTNGRQCVGPVDFVKCALLPKYHPGQGGTSDPAYENQGKVY